MASKKILVVDDTEMFQEIMKDILTERGYAVHAVRDGVEAIGKIRAEDFDLVLLDLLLPKMTGFDVLKEMRKHKSGSALPILAVSGVYRKEEHLASLRELGADGYISKNLTPAEIADRVERTLEEAAQAGPKEAAPPPETAPLDVDGALARMTLFKDLDESERSQIKNICVNKTFMKGQVIIREAAFGDTFYGIIGGAVRVEKQDVSGQSTVLARLSPGAEFGELALVDRDRRSATCVAETEVTALEISRQDFETALSKNPELERKCLRALLRVLTQRLREADTSLTFSRSLLEKVIETEA